MGSSGGDNPMGGWDENKAGSIQGTQYDGFFYFKIIQISVQCLFCILQVLQTLLETLLGTMAFKCPKFSCSF